MNVLGKMKETAAKSDTSQIYKPLWVSLRNDTVFIKENRLKNNFDSS